MYSRLIASCFPCCLFRHCGPPGWKASMDDTSLMILLIDDDEEVLVGLEEIIVSNGFSCSSFSDPQLAMEAFRRNGFDIVITDILMPRLNGVEVFRAIREINPAVFVIFITGFAHAADVLAEVENRDYFIFRKPLLNLGGDDRHAEPHPGGNSRAEGLSAPPASGKTIPLQTRCESISYNLSGR